MKVSCYLYKRTIQLTKERYKEILPFFFVVVVVAGQCFSGLNCPKKGGSSCSFQWRGSFLTQGDMYWKLKFQTWISASTSSVMFSTFNIYLLFEVCSDLRALAIDSSHTMRKQSFILVVFCLLLWILLCNVWLVVRMSQTRNHHYIRVYTLERKMSSVKWNYKVSQWRLQPLGSKSSRNVVWIHLLWGLSKYNICIYVSLSFNMHKNST